MKTTRYFIDSVMVRRPYLREEQIECALNEPIRTIVQSNGGIRRWAYITALGKHRRFVTEAGGF